MQTDSGHVPGMVKSNQLVYLVVEGVS